MLFDEIACRYFTRSRPVSSSTACQFVSNSATLFPRRAVLAFEVGERFRQRDAGIFPDARACRAMYFDQRCFHSQRSVSAPMLSDASPAAWIS